MRILKVALAPLFIIPIMLTARQAWAATDTAGHWAEEIINYSVSQGNIKGYEDGTFRPNNPIKRAEFVSLANKSMGYTMRGGAGFTDVNIGDWFYDDVSIAQKEGYISGMTDGTFRPNDVITRETAAVMAAKMLHLNQNFEYASYFTDSDLLSWSKGYVGASVKAKIISGYTNGRFNPGKPMTRAEAVSLINRVAGKKYDNSLDIEFGYKDYYTSTDNYDLQSMPAERQNYQSTGIATTTAPDSMGNYRLYNGNYGTDGTKEAFYSNVVYDPRYAGTVKNIYVEGDFEVSSFVHPDSTLILEDVKITGKLIINNPGHVVIKNSEIHSVECRSQYSGARVIATGTTTVDNACIFSSVELSEESLTNGRGFRNLEFDESCSSSLVSFYGDCNNITVNGKKSKLVVERGTADTVVIASEGSNCTVEVQMNAVINYLDVKSSCYVEGSGKITLAVINADDAVFDLKPVKVSGTKAPIYTASAHDGSGEDIGYNVEIFVADVSGKMLSGVSVRLGGFDTKTTAADGKAIFTNIPNGSYSCVLSLQNISPATETVTISGTSRSVTIIYDITERYIVELITKDGDMLLEGAVVTLTPEGASIGVSYKTLADGKAVFTDVIPGTYSWEAEYNGDIRRGTIIVKNLVISQIINFKK